MARLHDRIPTDAVGGMCIVTRKAKLKPGEKMIDIGVDYDSLPPMDGRLCISESGLAEIMSHAGWERRTEDDAEAHRVNAELRAELVLLRSHLRNVLAAAEAIDVDVGIDEELVSA